MVTTFILSIVGLLLSFYLLNEVTDRFFIPSLDAISHRLKMSDDAAGATLMASGSSAPELFIAIIALIYGGDNLEIGVGTIVGSALFNLLVIIGAVALVHSARVAWQPMFRDIIFYIGSILLLYWAFRDSQIQIMEVIIFLVFYFIYVVAVMNWKRWFPYERFEEEPEEDDDDPVWKKYLKPLDFIVGKFFPKPKFIYGNFTVSIIFIALLSWILVSSAVNISEFLGIPKYVIALTVLAFGTSVPDMISSIIVAKQGRGGMAISNALGSNIFDILIGLGMPWLVLAIMKGKAGFEVVTENINQHIVILLVSIVAVFGVFLASKWRINRFIGILFTGSYLAYLIYFYTIIIYQ